MGEMGRDEGENLQRETIDGDERVPPLTDSLQRSKGIPVELRNGIEGEPVFRKGGRQSTHNDHGTRLTTNNGQHASVPRSERRRAAKVRGLGRGKREYPSRG